MTTHRVQVRLGQCWGGRGNLRQHGVNLYDLDKHRGRVRRTVGEDVNQEATLDCCSCSQVSLKKNIGVMVAGRADTHTRPSTFSDLTSVAGLGPTLGRGPVPVVAEPENWISLQDRHTSGHHVSWVQDTVN